MIIFIRLFNYKSLGYMFTHHYKNLLFCLVLLLGGIESQSQIYLDSTQSIDVRVNDLIDRMTLDEKIGQMIQAERQAFISNGDITTYFIGSLLSGGGSAPINNTAVGWADMYDQFQSQALNTRLQIPLIYGVDAVHGHNNVKNAVIFPHNIGLGCTRNPELVREVAHITAKEVKGTGLNWTFAPCIAVVRNERWGRTYEGFGESTDLVSDMGVAAIEGLQGDSLNGETSILACAKHYIADGATQNGQDQGLAVMDEYTLRQLYLPPYIEAIEAGVGSVMISYSSMNGVKMHMHKYLITDLLKQELGFEGIVISDYAGIDQLPGTYAEKVAASVNAGIDMIMLPYNYVEFIQAMKSLVAQNVITQERIDDAVRRVLRIKFMAGLFENPYADRTYTNQVGSQAHRQVARESVRQSLVLLSKKDNILPIRKDNIKIHVSGKNADDIGNQCGGWTIAWQGISGEITEGTTVLEAIREVAGSENVSYTKDGSDASGADISIAVIGETPYAEYQGDKTILTLDPEDVTTVRNLKDAGAPVIVIIISGRPMLINDILPFSDAVIAAWLPGTEGAGIADILFGDFDPTGKLSYSWPVSMQQIPVNVGDESYEPLYPYGHGIASLQNSVPGEAPQYYSSFVTIEGDKVEVAFNKALSIASNTPSAFNIKANSALMAISKMYIKDSDNGTVVLELAGKIKANDKVKISYNGNAIASTDGGVLEAFDYKEVYNLTSENRLQVIPGTIEAEDFVTMSGVDTETTADSGGGLNVGWMDTGDWMEYMIDVPYNGIFKIKHRVAAESTAGVLSWMLSDSLITEVDVPVTGGWQKWQTVSTTCKLNKGINKYRLDVTKGGMNLNWIDFTVSYIIPDDSVTNDSSWLAQNVPNPFISSTKIEYGIAERGKVQLSIYDVNGKVMYRFTDENHPAGSFEINIDPKACGLQQGLYIYELIAGSFKKRLKMISN